MPQRSCNPIKLKNPLFLTLYCILRQLFRCLSHKSQVKMEGLTTTTPETLVNLEEPPPLDFANISSTETTTPELTTSILMQTMQTLLHNGTTLSPEILQDLKDTTTENLEALARNETIGEQELKEWQKTSKCIQMGQFLVIFQLCDLVSNINSLKMHFISFM